MLRITRSAVLLAVGILIFAGLPILAWGPNDAAAFFALPARAGYVALAILLQVAIVFKMPEVGRNRLKEERSIPRQKLALVLLQVLPLAIVLTAPFTDRRQIAVMGAGSAVRYAGLALFGSGFFLMHWAEAALGEQFTTQVAVSSEHRLVVDGPYRYVRHPRYLGIILFMVGISLVFVSWAALALAGTLAGVLIWRIGDEEKLLREKFGDQWESYCRGTWKVMPYVY